MKLTRMKYTSIDLVEWILLKSGNWRKEEWAASESVDEENPDIVNCIHYKCIKRFNLDISLFIKPDLTFEILLCDCVTECCGYRITEGTNTFSMRNVYKQIKKAINKR